MKKLLCSFILFILPAMALPETALDTPLTKLEPGIVTTGDTF